MPVTHALRSLGVLPANAVMAGDTPVDVAAASAAGVTPLGVAWGAAGAGPLRDAGAAAVAADVAELRQLILRADHPVERIAT
jgi:phosphoglycolate phosphatase-like HAD superfamily hydrolase